MKYIRYNTDNVTGFHISNNIEKCYVIGVKFPKFPCKIYVGFDKYTIFRKTIGIRQVKPIFNIKNYINRMGSRNKNKMIVKHQLSLFNKSHFL